MQRPLVVKSLSLGGSSDLTLLAPLKPGFVASLESVTYATRTKRTLAALHGLRLAAHEHAPVRLVSDAVERVTAIQTVRVAVFDHSNTVMLAVSFDGSWASYIRVLWHKVGTLLDLIFCNTVGYVTAREHSFADWEAWARRVQVESGFFYGPPDSSARDVLYHRRTERLAEHLGHAQQSAMAQHTSNPSAHPKQPPPQDMRPVRRLQTVLPSSETQVQRTVDPPQPLNPDDPQLPQVLQSRMVRERVRSGLAGLAALYRLTDLYRPGTPDGELLRQATADLLAEFVQMRDGELIDEELAEERDGPRTPQGRRPADGGRFQRALNWLFTPGQSTQQPRPAPALPAQFAIPAQVRADVQAGVLHPYPRINCGLVLLMAFDGPAAAAVLLQALREGAHALSTDAELPAADSEDFKRGRPDQVWRHLSFTAAGLRRLGLDEDELALFSEEFRQGMARRAGLLGDVHANHPLRWRLPKSEAGHSVDLDGVHAVLQLRCLAPQLDPDDADALPAALAAERQFWSALAPGLRVLAQQALRRHLQRHPTRELPKDIGPSQGPEVITEHYGYADGDGQPELEWGAGPGFARNRVLLGDVLLGHANAVDPALDALCPHVRQQQAQRLPWQHNGSYLVVRKYRQQVPRFEAAVTATARHMAWLLDGAAPSSSRLQALQQVVKAKLMGRYPNGRSLVDKLRSDQVNAFSYDLDPQGEDCPLHAHVRRANPRAAPGDLVRPPRLVRRSMSFGLPDQPAAAEANANADTNTNTNATTALERHTDDAAQPRGLLFMAYNASLGEQFEVVQRWLVGGNSTGASSAVSCPIVGLPQPGLPRHFQFQYQDGPDRPVHVFSVQLDEPNPHNSGHWPPVTAFDAFEPMTRLDWGLYLFSPSISALRLLHQRSLAISTRAGQAPAWSLAQGRVLLAQLQRMEAEQGAEAARQAWKAALEDPEAIDRLDSAALWAALRADHGGLLRTPYGVLVADRALAHQVYLDPQGQYSVSGQLDRMRHSFGAIALGMDDSPRYRQLATAVNTAIGQLQADEVFRLAQAAVHRRLRSIALGAYAQSLKVADPQLEVGLDARELLDEVLATLSEAWFGLQDGPAPAVFQRGPTDWQWQAGEPPLYPGHFTALSRYMFQPNPGPVAESLGQAYGQALRVAMRQLVAHHLAQDSLPKAPDADGFEPYRGQPAPLAAAVFKDPQHREDPSTDADLIGRTLVGVLMGFNPTITGAVLHVLAEWHNDGQFGALRLALLAASTGPAPAHDSAPASASASATAPAPAPAPPTGTADGLLAQRHLGPAMRRALLMRPMPQLGWRTVCKAHRLGDALRHAVDLQAGDRVVMAIVSGTQQSLVDGADDQRLMFGGVRAGPDGSYPTHACPGYDAGIAAVLGSLAGLAGWTGADLAEQLDDIQLRAGQGPFSFLIEARLKPPGPSAPAPSGGKPKDLGGTGPRAPNTPAAPPVPPKLAQVTGSPLILAWGDSWLDFPLDLSGPGKAAIDMRDWLADMGYRVPETYCKYTQWPTSGALAKRTGPFLDTLGTLLLSGQAPAAIVLSAGGNDSTGDALRGLLVPWTGQPNKLPVNHDALARHVQRIADNYATVVRDILAVQDAHGQPVPVFIHGYDHPAPRGKGQVLGMTYAKKWMYQPFQDSALLDLDQSAPARAVALLTMAHLIDALNAALIQLAEQQFAGRVHHVNLRGTLNAPSDNDAQDDWTDDLHPKPRAFAKLALRVHTAIEAQTQARAAAAAAAKP